MKESDLLKVICRTGGVSCRERQMLVLYLTWG